MESRAEQATSLEHELRTALEARAFYHSQEGIETLNKLNRYHVGTMVGYAREILTYTREHNIGAIAL